MPISLTPVYVINVVMNIVSNKQLRKIGLVCFDMWIIHCEIVPQLFSTYTYMCVIYLYHMLVDVICKEPEMPLLQMKCHNCSYICDFYWKFYMFMNIWWHPFIDFDYLFLVVGAKMMDCTWVSVTFKTIYMYNKFVQHSKQHNLLCVFLLYQNVDIRKRITLWKC